MSKKIAKFQVEPPLQGLQRVFVYGTLRMGGANHYLLSDNGKDPAVFQGFATTSGTLYADTDRLIPFALGGATTRIKGEVWDVTPRVMKVIDRLEGHPCLYRRVKTQVRMDSAELETPPEVAWLYWFQPVREDAPIPDFWTVIESGDFMAWLPPASADRNLRWAERNVVIAQRELDRAKTELIEAQRAWARVKTGGA